MRIVERGIYKTFLREDKLSFKILYSPSQRQIAVLSISVAVKRERKTLVRGVPSERHRDFLFMPRLKVSKYADRAVVVSREIVYVP